MASTSFFFLREDQAAFFDGVFLAEDSEVEAFVAEVRRVVKSTGGKASCGNSQWSAARETSKQANKLDEEGVEIAVCRHGFLLKGLNMFRGEIFAYPMFLQKEFQTATFFAMDVTCRYVPYLQKVTDALHHLAPLKDMKPSLSVMHARAHCAKCEIKWSARNQEGVGTTLGEEVEQVNSFLSRCALTTKYMSKPARTDMLTVHAMGWNERKRKNLQQALCSRFSKTVNNIKTASLNLSKMQEGFQCTDDTLKLWVDEVKEWARNGRSAAIPGDVTGLQESIENLFLSIRQKKHYIYRDYDRNKKRHNVAVKIAQQKRRLLQKIEQYNQQSAADKVDVTTVQQKLSAKTPDSMIWPWEDHVTDGVDMFAKKELFDQQMLLSRLEEERQILAKEMMQHCSYLNHSQEKVHALLMNILDFPRSSVSEDCLWLDDSLDELESEMNWQTERESSDDDEVDTEEEEEEEEET
ncbi:hypothetical protein FQA47_022143 [Oryzias melastigma]|uniref:Uncharacterized protein n=1 Tax=Oryzias melastigma TaxID=30732 RepID=A0A834FMY4_ORYME|nr:hypothetical protein FQA47_022143 [Oryzias melastigma]